MNLTISSKHMHTMLRFSRCIQSLEQHDVYAASLKQGLPESTSYAHGQTSVLMGYDFHLSEQGPKLIEVNTNAGGLFQAPNWLPQPAWFEWGETLEQRLQKMFTSYDIQCMAIVDEDVRGQFMYPEMQAYASLLRQAGLDVIICSPEDLCFTEDAGLRFEGKRVDMIYNRHTDFYLEDASMQAIASAWKQGHLVLTPHPRSYGLLADKARMADWHAGLLDHILSADDLALVKQVVPKTCYLAEQDLDAVWSERKRWVFKPMARHGGKGVVLGRAMSRKRFASLDPKATVMQEYVPAMQVERDGLKLKTDIRLYMDGQQLIACAVRAFQGQLTNFRSEGSGWWSLSIEDDS